MAVLSVVQTEAVILAPLENEATILTSPAKRAKTQNIPIESLAVFQDLSHLHGEQAAQYDVLRQEFIAAFHAANIHTRTELFQRLTKKEVVVEGEKENEVMTKSAANAGLTRFGDGHINGKGGHSRNPSPFAETVAGLVNFPVGKLQQFVKLHVHAAAELSEKTETSFSHHPIFARAPRLTQICIQKGIGEGEIRDLIGDRHAALRFFKGDILDQHGNPRAHARKVADFLKVPSEKLYWGLVAKQRNIKSKRDAAKQPEIDRQRAIRKAEHAAEMEMRKAEREAKRVIVLAERKAEANKRKRDQRAPGIAARKTTTALRLANKIAAQVERQKQKSESQSQNIQNEINRTIRDVARDILSYQKEVKRAQKQAEAAETVLEREINRTIHNVADDILRYRSAQQAAERKAIIAEIAIKRNISQTIQRVAHDLLKYQAGLRAAEDIARKRHERVADRRRVEREAKQVRMAQERTAKEAEERVVKETKLRAARVAETQRRQAVIDNTAPKKAAVSVPSVGLTIDDAQLYQKITAAFPKLSALLATTKGITDIEGIFANIPARYGDNRNDFRLKLQDLADTTRSFDAESGRPKPMTIFLLDMADRAQHPEQVLPDWEQAVECRRMAENFAQLISAEVQEARTPRLFQKSTIERLNRTGLKQHLSMIPHFLQLRAGIKSPVIDGCLTPAAEVLVKIWKLTEALTRALPGVNLNPEANQPSKRKNAKMPLDAVPA